MLPPLTNEVQIGCKCKISTENERSYSFKLPTYLSVKLPNMHESNIISRSSAISNSSKHDCSITQPTEMRNIQDHLLIGQCILVRGETAPSTE